MATVNAYKVVASDYTTWQKQEGADLTFAVGTDVAVNPTTEIARAPAYLTSPSGWVYRNNLGPGFHVVEFTPFALLCLQSREGFDEGGHDFRVLQVSFDSLTQQVGSAMHFWNTDSATATFWVTGCHVVAEV